MLSQLETLDVAWQQRKESVCRIEESNLESKGKSVRLELRNRHTKIAPREARNK